MPTTRLPATGGPKLNDVGPRPLSGKTVVTSIVATSFPKERKLIVNVF